MACMITHPGLRSNPFRNPTSYMEREVQWLIRTHGEGGAPDYTSNLKRVSLLAAISLLGF